MKNTLLALSTALVVVMSAGFANAADAIVPQPEEPAYVPFTWTGFYVGAHAGGAFGGRDEVGYGTTPNVGEFKYGGWLGGIHAGYNYQINQIVLGLETDFQFSGIDDKFSAAPFSGDADIKWYGTLRPRVGYAFDRTLVFATGGLAYGKVDYVVNGPLGPIASDDTHVGWTAGAGLEHAFTDNLIARVEYQYVDLGKDTLTNARGAFTNETPNFHSVRAGISFKW